jgi:hypothetical protein
LALRVSDAELEQEVEGRPPKSREDSAIETTRYARHGSGEEDFGIEQ